MTAVASPSMSVKRCMNVWYESPDFDADLTTLIWCRLVSIDSTFDDGNIADKLSTFYSSKLSKLRRRYDKPR